MSLVGTVRLDGTSMFMGAVLDELPGASLQVQYQATATEYTFEASGCDFDSLERALAADETIADPRVISDFDSVRVYRVRPTLDRPLLSEAAASLDVQVLETESVDGEWQVRVRLPDRSALAELKRHYEEYGVEFRVQRLYSETSLGGNDENLTDAQRDVLVTAYEMGYLEEPRACSLADLAAELGVSSSAASGRFRRGVAELVERHVITE